jgi:thiamine transporter
MISLRFECARGAEKSAEIGQMPGTLEPDPGNAGVGIKIAYHDFRVAYPQSREFFMVGGMEMNDTLRKITETAIMLAVATVLSLLQFKGPWALGGSITACSMLPIILITHRYGTKWGLMTALTYSLLQLMLGLQNVQYAPDALTAIGIIALDYILAFGVLGFAAVFDLIIKNKRISIVVGIVVTMFGRFLCHFASGVIIWEVLWPNSLGWATWIWSLSYNGSYMLPEILITSVAALVLFQPTKKFWYNPALPKQA